VTGILAGRRVGRIGYGTRQLVGCDREEAVTVLRRAVELGVKHIDTADFYGAGVANERVRDALFPYQEDIALVTKVGVAYDATDGLTPAQRPEQLRIGVEANLRRLGTEQLAVVNLRRIDTGPRLIATGDQQVDLASQLAELVALRDEGKIGGIGLSNVNLKQLRTAIPAGIVCVQNVYNVCERVDEPILDECRQHDVAWVPFFPLGSPAIPSRVADYPAVLAIARALDAAPPQIGLAWLLAHDPSILLIPGTTDPRHVEENLGAADVRLDPANLAMLDGLAQAVSAAD